MPRKGFLKRLADKETIICAEGYLIEFERRGYLQAGGYFPEVVLQKPEIVRQLHEEFIHAGSDIVVSFTFYGHRKKMRQLGREEDVELLNRTAIQIAKDVADKNGCLIAGNICGTGLFLPKDYDEIKAMFEEQVRWAKEEGVDLIIAETFKALDESLLALEVIKQADIPAVVTISPHSSDKTFDGIYIPDALKQLENQGAAVVGVNCGRGPKSMLPLVKEAMKVCKGPVAAVPVVYRTSEEVKCWQALKDPDTANFELSSATSFKLEESKILSSGKGLTGVPYFRQKQKGSYSFPMNLQCHQCNRSEIRQFGEEAKKAGVRYIGLCCGNSSFYLREIAEAYGREPAASKYRPSLEQSLYFADENQLSEDRLKMRRFILDQ